MTYVDFVVLGGGDAGLTPAHLVAQAGHQVAVIDPGPIGGLCNRGGCKPKKILVRATEVLDEVRQSGEHGISTGEVDIDWAHVIDRTERFTSGVTAEAKDSLAEAGIELLSGYPEFRSRSSLAVNDHVIEFDAALISTGSSPRELTVPGAEHTITTDEFLNLRIPPSRMVVLGAGFSGFEFGQVAARLGAEVHLLHPGPQALKGEDAEMVAALVEFSRSLDLHVWDNAPVQRITADDGEFVVEAETPNGERRWQADVVLNAAGRVPNLDGLQLETADVEASENGVQADKFLHNPSNRRIFTAGDAHDGYQYKLCTMACLEGRIAARNYLNGDVEPMDYSGVPQVVYTEPPLASVGLTEEEAKEQAPDVEIVRADVAELGPYRILGETEGCSKLLFDAQTSQLLGAHLYGAEAGEHIHMFAIAVQLGLTRDQLGQLAFACPTRASSLLCMLEEYRGQGTAPH
jgi:glutathione reductase (NADPH)